jgi:hypothetical protein
LLGVENSLAVQVNLPTRQQIHSHSA